MAPRPRRRGGRLAGRLRGGAKGGGGWRRGRIPVGPGGGTTHRWLADTEERLWCGGPRGCRGPHRPHLSVRVYTGPIGRRDGTSAAAAQAAAAAAAAVGRRGRPRWLGRDGRTMQQRRPTSPPGLSLSSLPPSGEEPPAGHHAPHSLPSSRPRSPRPAIPRCRHGPAGRQEWSTGWSERVRGGRQRPCCPCCLVAWPAWPRPRPARRPVGCIASDCTLLLFLVSPRRDATTGCALDRGRQ